MESLKAIRPHFFDGAVVEVGAHYEAPDKSARELVATGKAEYSAPPKKRKGPMTTKDDDDLLSE